MIICQLILRLLVIVQHFFKKKNPVYVLLTYYLPARPQVSGLSIQHCCLYMMSMNGVILGNIYLCPFTLLNYGIIGLYFDFGTPLFEVRAK